MDTAIECILEIYRAAQDTPVDEFQTLGLKLLQELVPFRSAMWGDLDNSPRGVTAYAMRLFNEPDEFMKEMPVMNSRHPGTIQLATRDCGVAVSLYTPRFYAGEHQADMRDYIRRYGHEHNLAIGDLDRPHARGEWLGLYRPGTEEAFSERDRKLVTLLTPHLVEAMTINRKLALGRDGVAPTSRGGTRALVRTNGVVIHCGSRFCELLSDDWPDWRYTRLPPALLLSLQRNGRAAVANRTVRIAAKKLGDLLFLSAKKLSPLVALSERERVVVRMYGRGRSHKEIARQLELSPVTVRNFIQHAYRKLDIHSKEELIRLLESHRR